MSQCVNCESRFFKILETRILVDSFTGMGHGMLLLKKRCKRCKYKFFFSKEYPSGKTGLISYSLWLEGIRIPNLTRKISNGFQVFAGEFSRKIRGRAEDTIHYLNRLDEIAGVPQRPISQGYGAHG